MKTVNGKITQILDDYHVILEDNNKNKYFIGQNNLINDNNIGKKFTCNLTPRYSCSKIIKKNNGKYKFLYFMESINIIPENCKYLYYFKNNNNNKIIEITLSDNKLNNSIIGENFNLKELYRDYKAITVLPYLPENENILYSKVLITKKYNDTYYEGVYKNKTIAIKSDYLKPDYIGINILAELIPKFISTSTIIGKKNIKQNNSKLLLNLNIKGNLLVSNNEKLQEQYIVNSNNGIIITNNNIGKKIITPFNNLMFIKPNTFTLTNNKNNYKLIEIKREYDNRLTGNNIYYFLTKDNNIIISIIYENINMDGLLGKYFSFDYLEIYYLQEMLANGDNIDDEYLLTAILNNNIYIFNKNNIIYYVNINQFIISSSSIGKYFNLVIKNYIIISSINDVY